jgi:hypothetical protein
MNATKVKRTTPNLLLIVKPSASTLAFASMVLLLGTSGGLSLVLRAIKPASLKKTYVKLPPSLIHDLPTLTHPTGWRPLPRKPKSYCQLLCQVSLRDTGMDKEFRTGLLKLISNQAGRGVSILLNRKWQRHCREVLISFSCQWGPKPCCTHDTSLHKMLTMTTSAMEPQWWMPFPTQSIHFPLTGL